MADQLSRHDDTTLSGEIQRYRRLTLVTHVTGTNPWHCERWRSRQLTSIRRARVGRRQLSGVRSRVGRLMPRVFIYTQQPFDLLHTYSPATSEAIKQERLDRF